MLPLLPLPLCTPRAPTEPMLILGLNMFHADASAAIVHDGDVVFAMAEERLNRRKHFGGFPVMAVKACLDAVGANISDIDHVAVGASSDANRLQKIQYALANPAEVFNFIKLRQRKGSMRDLRKLLAGALDLDEIRSEEHTSELQSRENLVCRLLLEKKKKKKINKIEQSLRTIKYI